MNPITSITSVKNFLMNKFSKASLPEWEIVKERFEDTRDRGLRFYNASNTGYPNLHIISRDGQDDRESGITVAKQFYIRTLWDPEQQNTVTVASPMIEAMYRTKDEDGTYRLAKVNNDPDIYILGAWKDELDGETLARLINTKLLEHRDIAMNRESFYIEPTPVDPENLDGDWALRSVNAALGFVCVPKNDLTPSAETKDSDPSYIVRCTVPIKSPEEQALDKFTRTPVIPSGLQLNFGGENHKIPCKSFDSALKTLASLTNAASNNHRKGNPDLITVTQKIEFSNIKNKFLRTTFEKACANTLPHLQKAVGKVQQKYKSIVNNDYKEGLVIGTGWGVAMTAGQYILSKGFAGLAVTLAQNTLIGLAVKFGETVTTEAWNAMKDLTLRDIKLNGEKSILDRDMGYLYAAETEDNSERALKKGNPDKLRKLIALEHYQTQIPALNVNGKPSNLVTMDSDTVLQKLQYLTLRDRLHGSNYAPVGNTNMGWDIYGNGGVCFRHFDEGNGYSIIKAYFVLNRDNAVSPKIPLDILKEIADSQDAFERDEIAEEELIQVKKVVFVRGILPVDHPLKEKYPHESYYQAQYVEDNLTAEDAISEITYTIKTTCGASTDYNPDVSLTEGFEELESPLTPVGVMQHLTEIERQRRIYALSKLEEDNGVIHHLTSSSSPRFSS